MAEKEVAAWRAKEREDAVEKMRNGDFSGACEIALQARKLFITVDSFERIVLVCNVHCSAAEGKDWYKILGIDAEAHEDAVKKQWAKMVRGLHPDRNQFPGAVEAFQLIMEAKAVLLDSEKRRVYDQDYKSVPEITPDPEFIEYEEAEFNDFEKERSRTCFEAGQIWAAYDELDAMPRLYAMIDSILDDHEMQITWLEPLPNDNDEKKWLDRDLPASCGRFTTECTAIIEDHEVFSHLAKWKRDAVSRYNYIIHPQKGQTWAVFKNWDIKWDCDPQRTEEFQYDIVEILSDYQNEFGVEVGYLHKIEGFNCIFGREMREGVDSEVIKAKDKLRFSHRILSFSVNIDRPNGLETFFELDPASLPRSFGSSDP